jgi:DNA-binding NtrC family response regulator
MKTVLVVDDDRVFRTYIADALRSRGYVVDMAESGGQLLDRLASGTPPSIILLDVHMPETDGIELISKVKALGWNIPVIMLSGMNHVRTVVEAMKLGACDFVTKPCDEEALQRTIERALTAETPAAATAIAKKVASMSANREFLSLNPKMCRLAEIIARVAPTDVAILIAGESGVGKEVMARQAHTHSPRSDRAFIKVNCAAVPHELLESELFGYERGAFTGAVADKPGKFQLADGGTLFLDEIGEMSAMLQAKLLHVLQDGSVSPLGSRKTTHVDVRIIAATNINIEKAVADGRFREDLYFRLNVIRVDLPPLRERKEDIPELCNFFIEKYVPRYSKTGPRDLPPDLVNRFLRYNWPGNIRQLENVIKRFLVLPDGDGFFIEDGQHTETEAPPAVTSIDKPRSLLDVRAFAAERAEKELVRRVLEETHGNRKRAAQRMNICYKALLNKLKRWNAIPEESHPAA